MTIESILNEIDLELARLQEVRSILANSSTPVRRGRAAKKSPLKATAKKRTMSPEGRAKIAAAQKKRWAAQKKAAK